MVTEFPLARASTNRKWLLCLGLMVIPSAILGFVVGVQGRQPVQALWFSGAVCLLMVASFIFFDRSRQVRFLIGQRELRVTGDVFGKAFPLASLHLQDAAILDLTEAAEFRPRWKIFGTALPGYAAGEFSLRNGKHAFCFLSDLHRVLGIPATGGKYLLLSCEDPPAVLATLRHESVD